MRRRRLRAQRRREHGARVRVRGDARQARVQLVAGARAVLRLLRWREPSAHPRLARLSSVPSVARGTLITIEGLDGAGKTTLATALTEAIAARGLRVELLREPGGVEVSERIRALRQGPGAGGRARAPRRCCTRPRARSSSASCLRRCWTKARSCCWTATSTPRWPTRAPRAGLASSSVREINRFATADLQPERTLLLRISPADGRARQAERAESPDRLERESGEFFARDRRRLRRAGGAEPERIRVLDASLAPAPCWSTRSRSSRICLRRQAERRASMRATMASPPKRTAAAHRIRRALAATLALLALASAVAWAGLSAANAAKPVGKPAFPTPASAKPQSPSAGVTTGSATAATPGASTPTTTYAPPGGATAPATTARRRRPRPRPRRQRQPPRRQRRAQATPAAQASAAKSKTSKSDSSLSAGAIVIAALAALLVLGCAAWALARSSAFEPHWLLSLRHAMAEAGFRASATWSEFADWARLGR